MLDTLIVGAGLSGLSVASRLQAAGRDFLLVDARVRAGGRIETVPAAAGAVALDLGPGWFWPQTQPRMARLIAELGLAVYPQHDSGTILHLPQADGSPEALAQSGVHNGAHRVAGGMAAIVDAMVRRLPAGRLRTGCELTRLVDRDDHVDAYFRGECEDFVIVARRVVLAMPPRLVAERIAFEPALDGRLMEALQDTPTWMAAQAKVAMRYDTPFWRAAGLSGNAFVSHPQAVLAEMFDACDADAGSAALGGFVALSPSQRKAYAASLALLVRSQFAQLFGPRADEGELHVRDWSNEALTCSVRDAVEPGRHPDDGNAVLAAPCWAGRLHLAGSETAGRGAGYLEGALDAAARVCARLLDATAASSIRAQLSPENGDSLARFATWVAGQRALGPELYRQGVARVLAAQQGIDMTRTVLLDVIDRIYADALMQIDRLSFDTRKLPVEQGRCALTPAVLEPFSGFSDALIAAAVAHNATSCAISNFPDEHRPAADYLRQIRHELALAWRDFALSVNGALLAGTPEASTLH